MLKNLLFVGPRFGLADEVGNIARKILPDPVLKFHNSKLGQPASTETLAGSYDVLFLTHDLGLPGESGLAWLREFKEQNVEGRIVVLVGAGYEVVRDSAIELGASACFATDAAGSIALADWLSATRDQIIKLEDTIPPELRGSDELPEPGIKPGWSEAADVLMIPGYRLEGVLARGHLTATYSAVSLAEKKAVALKVLDLHGESDAGFLERFLRDYAALAQLEHPHVNRIYSRGVADRLAYFAMEPCPRGDLRSKQRPMGIRPALALDYLEQIAKGLGAAHRLGVIHRDLKPADIFFREPGTLVVADFGVARNSSGNPLATRDQVILGTPLYISPEQIEDRPIDARTDLYSLGAIYFHLLTGDPPFKADSRMMVLELHLHAPIPKLPMANLAYEPLVEGLLAKDPDDRFQNAEELLKGIEWVRKSI